MPDTYDLLISICDALNTLQLDANGKVMDVEKMQEDVVEDEDLCK